MTRFILYALVATLITLGLMYAAAWQAGIDPLSPTVRTLASVSALAAVYVGVRVAMVVRQIGTRGVRAGETSAGAKDEKRRSAFSRWGRSDKLDARMRAREERVRRARQAQAEKPD